MRSVLLSITLIAAFLLWGSHASAVAVLDLGGSACHEQSQCSIGLSGGGHDTTLATFSTPVVATGTDDFFATPGGMMVGSGTFPNAFALTFSNTVAWSGAALESAHNFAGLSVEGPELSASGLLADPGVSAFSFAAPLTLLANQTYEFVVAEIIGFGFASLSSLTFAATSSSASPSTVPLPPAMLMLLAGLG